MRRRRTAPHPSAESQTPIESPHRNLLPAAAARLRRCLAWRNDLRLCPAPCAWRARAVQREQAAASAVPKHAARAYTRRAGLHGERAHLRRDRRRAALRHHRLRRRPPVVAAAQAAAAAAARLTPAVPVACSPRHPAGGSNILTTRAMLPAAEPAPPATRLADRARTSAARPPPTARWRLNPRNGRTTPRAWKAPTAAA